MIAPHAFVEGLFGLCTVCDDSREASAHVLDAGYALAKKGATAPSVMAPWPPERQWADAVLIKLLDKIVVALDADPEDPYTALGAVDRLRHRVRPGAADGDIIVMGGDADDWHEHQFSPTSSLTAAREQIAELEAAVRDLSGNLAGYRVALARFERCYLDKPEDRLYHAEDGTWWRRDDSRGTGTLVAADPPPVRRCDDAAQAWTETKEALDLVADLRAKLALVATDTADVWYYQGDGGDHIDSPEGRLTCPVVMSADTLRALLAKGEPQVLHGAVMTRDDGVRVYGPACEDCGRDGAFGTGELPPRAT